MHGETVKLVVVVVVVVVVVTVDYNIMVNTQELIGTTEYMML